MFFFVAHSFEDRSTLNISMVNIMVISGANFTFSCQEIRPDRKGFIKISCYFPRNEAISGSYFPGGKRGIGGGWALDSHDK